MSAALDIAQHIFKHQSCGDRFCRCHDQYKGEQTFTHCAAPGHEDVHPSMSVAVKDGRLLVKCWSRCAQDVLVAALKAGGLWPESSSQVGGGGATPRGDENAQSVKSVGLTVEQYAETKALPVDELRAHGLSDMTYEKLPAIKMMYFDEAGQEGPVRFRKTMFKAEEGPDARFAWRKNSKPTLYGLWRRKEAIRAGYVVLAEGESDCHTLWHHGIPALGVPGATNWKDARDAPHFDGIDVVYVIEEPDAGGEALRSALTESTICDKVKFVRLDGVKDASALHLACVEVISGFSDLRSEGEETPSPLPTVYDLFQERWDAAIASAQSLTDLLEAEAGARYEQAWEVCQDLAHEPSILNLVAPLVAKLGVAGEERPAKLLFLVIVSRFLSMPISGVVKGPSSAGKSYLVQVVLSIFPPEAYYSLSGMSERALAYSSEPMKHRFLVLFEAAGLDSQYANYLIRSLLSEGRIRYETVQKTDHGLESRLIEREGPTGLLMTTTEIHLHQENETRFFSIPVTDTPQQTRRIFRAQAEIAAGHETEDVDLKPWHALQVWLEGAEHRVVVPFGNVLAELVPTLAVRLRRDFPAVLRLIQAHALLHQSTRDRDEQGRVIATLEDYGVVHDLTGELIADVVDAAIPQTVRDVVAAVKKVIDGGKLEATIKEVGEVLKLDKATAWRRVQVAIDKGLVRNEEDKKGRPARLIKGADLPDDIRVLPTVEEVEERFHDFTDSDGDEVLPPPPFGWDDQGPPEHDDYFPGALMPMSEVSTELTGFEAMISTEDKAS